MHETLITPAGLELLNDELERLRTRERRAMAERIRAAISTDADASANADYQAAREEQAELEARILRLEQRLADADVAHADPANDLVDLGERVRLHDLDTDDRLEYEIVGRLEAAPARGRISASSPLGRALIGRRVGEVTDVETPSGRRRLRILAATQPGTRG